MRRVTLFYILVNLLMYDLEESWMLVFASASKQLQWCLAEYIKEIHPHIDKKLEKKSRF